MGTKKQKGTVSIENIDNRIRLRWRFQTKRYSLNLFLFSKANIIQANKIAAIIENDILLGRFDATLRNYKPTSRQAPIEQKALVILFEDWVRNYRNMSCDTDIDYNSTRNMMRKWGNFTTSNILNHFNGEVIGAKTYNRRLNLLKAFFNWAVKAGICIENPLEDVIPRKAKKTAKKERKPFTEDEIKRILMAFKNDTFCPKVASQKHSHYYPFIYFLFKTGVRNAEAVGLRVQCIDLDKKLIHIREVLARSLKGTNAGARIRKETKNGKHRIIPLTEDLQELLVPLVLNKEPDSLVFLSPTGTCIDDNMFQKRIFRKILSELNIEHRVLYACRHTFGSRCIHQGLTPVMTAFLMGNNPETALRNYTHMLSLPEQLPNIL